MNAFNIALLSGCIALSAGAAFAQDAMKKDDAMTKKEMTMRDCKDHMAMAKKDGMKMDDAMMKKDAMCADMMKKDGMAKDGMMKKDGMTKDDAHSEPMKK
jgi:pentapeptide MXKDX repeat protein